MREITTTVLAAAATAMLLVGGSAALGSTSTSDPVLTAPDAAPVKCFDKLPDGSRKPVRCPDIIVYIPAAIERASGGTMFCMDKDPKTGKDVKVKCPDIILPNE